MDHWKRTVFLNSSGTNPGKLNPDSITDLDRVVQQLFFLGLNLVKEAMEQILAHQTGKFTLTRPYSSLSSTDPFLHPSVCTTFFPP